MLSWCEGYLAKNGDPDPRSSAQWLVGHATGLQKIELYLDLDRTLNAAELDFMRDAVRRRAKGEPLQYLTGSAPFRFITVEVEPGVLIPRPETEVLVSVLLDMLPKSPRRIATDSHSREELEALLDARTGEAHKAGQSQSQRADGVLAGDEATAGQVVGAAQDEAANDTADAVCPADNADSAPSAGHTAASHRDLLQVLEIGTGSGCIACSLASERGDVAVTATDISSVAVSLARHNAERLQVADRVEVLECDLGDGISPDRYGTFDALISNPPYIPTEVYRNLIPEVHDYEPRLALDGGADGLDFFRRLLPFAAQVLKPGGAFCCELHEESLASARILAEEAGYTEVAIIEDMAGRPRIIAARTPSRCVGQNGE